MERVRDPYQGAKWGSKLFGNLPQITPVGSWDSRKTWGLEVNRAHRDADGLAHGLCAARLSTQAHPRSCTATRLLWEPRVPEEQPPPLLVPGPLAALRH